MLAHIFMYIHTNTLLFKPHQMWERKWHLLYKYLNFFLIFACDKILKTHVVKCKHRKSHWKGCGKTNCKEMGHQWESDKGRKIEWIYQTKEYLKEPFVFGVGGWGHSIVWSDDKMQRLFHLVMDWQPVQGVQRISPFWLQDTNTNFLRPCKDRLLTDGLIPWS